MARRLSGPARRSQILEAAERAIGPLGWGGVRLEDVADEAGVAKSLIFKHWPSKEALFDELRIRLYERYRGRQEEAIRAARTDAEAVARATEAGVFFFAEHPHAWTVFTRQGGAKIDLMLDTGFFQRAMASRLGSDTPDEEHSRLLAGIVVGTHLGLVGAATAGVIEVPAEDLARYDAVLCVGGIDRLARAYLDRGVPGADEVLAEAGVTGRSAS